MKGSKKMSRRKPIKSKVEAITLYADDKIDTKEFMERMNVERTTAENYKTMIRRFMNNGTRPNMKAIGKEFFVWADNWEKGQDIEQKQPEGENRKIKYKMELIIWEYK